MKKKLLLIFFILILLGTGATAYLNNIFLPQKIRSLIINNLQEATQKKVSLDSLKFSIFKGLVLKGLILYDADKTIVNIKEASCTFLILPLLQKKLIIPNVKVKQAVIFIERKSDNAFNIPLLITPKPPIAQLSTERPEKEVKASTASETTVIAQKKFKLTVNSISVKDSRIYFQDKTLIPVFTKSLDDVNLNLTLSLHKNFKFSLRAKVLANPVMNIAATGEYNKEGDIIAAKISLQDFSAQEFSAYIKSLGIEATQGSINAAADLKYLLKENKFSFSGNADVREIALAGATLPCDINSINGELAFDNSGISSKKLSADIFGIALIAQFKLQDYKNPLLDINIASTLSLDSAQGLLKDKFKFTLPVSIKGNAALALNIQGKMPMRENLLISGYADIINAQVKPDRLPSPLEDVNGRVEFSRNQARWKDLNFKYSGILYKSSGNLEDFSSPSISLMLASDELLLNSNFSVKKNLISFERLEGRYLNSGFSVSGNIDTLEPPKLETDLKGELNLDARDFKNLFVKLKNQLEKAKLEGALKVQFNLKGDVNDFKSCALKATLSGPYLSGYGLRAQDISIDYNQGGGLAEIPLMRLFLYDGIADIAASINLSSQNIPYWVTLDIQKLKLEKMKMDLAAGQKDIAGTLSSQVKINGFSNEFSRLSGTGKILIVDGKLWQLNLFKGLGFLVFAKDFADIIFKEGSCDFLIKDKQISSDNVMLKSNIADMSGTLRLGFDGSLDALLNVKILDENAPLTGGFKDLTTAIIGEAGRFGIIKINGTLKDPKYKFKPAVGDIIKGLKDIILGK